MSVFCNPKADGNPWTDIWQGGDVLEVLDCCGGVKFLNPPPPPQPSLHDAIHALQTRIPSANWDSLDLSWRREPPNEPLSLPPHSSGLPEHNSRPRTVALNILTRPHVLRLLLIPISVSNSG